MIDTATGTVIGTIDAPGQPTGDVDADPTGRVVYIVQNASRQVSVLDAVTGVLIAEVSVGYSPHRLAFGPPRTRRTATPHHR
ncbi:YncE family protein [Nonomuraea typhae]|uniref:YncE family protein n=1 Tax=Nonomuraea typhae TaxID=2603600 RepID=A0ABW7YRE2_9ACTN